MFKTGNYIESGLWILIGLVFVVYALRRSGGARRLCSIAAPVFVLFGISDIVEADTGAWYKPWWLFAWKAICVASMVCLLFANVRRQHREKTAMPPEQDAN